LSGKLPAKQARGLEFKLKYCGEENGFREKVGFEI
jgi:hypothetical protein